MKDDTFVIGDTHGHLDRLEALLQQEGLLDDEGKRLRPNVEVVHLGDLCHLGFETIDDDHRTLELAPDWLDVMLWGNHDYAVQSPRHHFGGYAWSAYSSRLVPGREWTDERQRELERSGKLRLAHERHGFLLTHAGLHPKVLDRPFSAKQAADWLNSEVLPNDDRVAARDAISFNRGGSHFYGGVLWRDAREDLCFAFPQVFGHSSYPEVRQYKPDHGDESTFTSYCIDVGDKTNGLLAGIWLPSETVVGIDASL